MNYILRLTAVGVFKLPTLRMKQLVISVEIGNVIQYSVRVSRLFGGPHGCLCMRAQIYSKGRKTNGESQPSRTSWKCFHLLRSCEKYSVTLIYFNEQKYLKSKLHK